MMNSLRECTHIPLASEGWGKVMFSVCSHLGGGGYPYPIMLCNISQNAMGQPGGTLWGGTLAGGYPGQGGTLAGGVPWPGGTLAGGYPARSSQGVPCGGYPGQGEGTLAGGYPARSSWGGTLWGVPWLGGYPDWGDTLWGGTLARGVPWPGGYPGWGGVPS